MILEQSSGKKQQCVVKCQAGGPFELTHAYTQSALCLNIIMRNILWFWLLSAFGPLPYVYKQLLLIGPLIGTIPDLINSFWRSSSNNKEGLFGQTLPLTCAICGSALELQRHQIQSLCSNSDSDWCLVFCKLFHVFFSSPAKNGFGPGPLPLRYCPCLPTCCWVHASVAL